LSFSIATRDELWLHGRLVERRLAHGRAIEDESGITATDARDDSLVAACDAAMNELHAYVDGDARTRLVAEASSDGVMKTIVVTLANRSVVTTPEHFHGDVALLRSAGVSPGTGDRGGTPPAQPARTPAFLWLHGSAAVLLHEAVGHPLEHEQRAVALPSWLTVDVPLKPRRASFKDVPLLRMTDVVARQSNAPFALADERVEIVLVDGGAYDPLTEVVTLRIAAANLVEGNRVRALAPFTIRETRESIARSIIGASGEPLRYPGVICSREGQELVVGSYAPLLLTEWR
jgi:hypothetical protein